MKIFWKTVFIGSILAALFSFLFNFLFETLWGLNESIFWSVYGLIFISIPFGYMTNFDTIKESAENGLLLGIIGAIIVCTFGIILNLILNGGFWDTHIDLIPYFINNAIVFGVICAIGSGLGTSHKIYKI